MSRDSGVIRFEYDIHIIGVPPYLQLEMHVARRQTNAYTIYWLLKTFLLHNNKPVHRRLWVILGEYWVLWEVE